MRGCLSFKPNSVESRDWRLTTSQNVLIRRSSGRNFKEAREIHASGILSRLPFNFSIGLVSEMCMTLLLYQPLRRCNDVNAHKVFTNLFYCVFFLAHAEKHETVICESDFARNTRNSNVFVTDVECICIDLTQTKQTILISSSRVRSQLKHSNHFVSSRCL